MVSSFIGRKDELAVLRELAGRLAENHSVAGLIVGDPGSGKTRLLNEFRRQAAGPDLPAIAGYESGQGLPLAAASDLLRSLTKVGAEGERLGALLYEESHLGSEPELLRIYESAHRCLAGLDRAIMFVDDLQWLDQPTAVLCHYLVRAAHSTGRPLGLIAAARSSPAADSFGGALRGVFVASDDYAYLALKALSRREGIELARELSPGIGNEEADSLWERARGSPFWLELLAREGSREIVGRLISGRLKGISTDAAGLMTLLVVAARPVSVEEAQSELKWAADRVDLSAHELLGRGVIVRSVNTLVVTHDLVRSAVAKEVPAASARAMHTRIVRYLELQGSDDPGVLAEALAHRRAGGLPSDRLALALARSPRRRLLGLDVLGQLETIADEAETDDGAALNVAVASLAAELRQHESALRRFESVFERLPVGRLKAEAALETSRVAFELSRAEESRRWLDVARASVTQDLLLQIQLDVQEALLLRWAGHDPDRSHALSRKALSAARRAIEADEVEDAERCTRTYLMTLRAEFDAVFQSQDVEESVKLADEMAAAQGDDEQRMRAGISVAVLMLESGRVRAATERFDRVRLEARRRVVPMAEVEAAFYASCCLRYLGRFAEASKLARAAAELAERVGTPTRMSMTWVRSLGHLVDLSLGDWRDAVAGIEAQLDAENDPHYRLLLRYNLATGVARLARPNDAVGPVLTQFEAGLRDAEIAGCARCRGEFNLRLAESLLRIGGVDAADGLLAEWDETHSRALGQQRFLRAWARSLRSLALDDQTVAVEHLGDLVAEAEGLGFVLESLWVELDLGRALAILDSARGVATLKAAAERASRLGAVNEERVALRALRDLGVRAWRRAAKGPESLSPREREVARLVVAGASNPEIAEALFIARKTVERHVSNILAKSGARNRTELAGRLDRDPALAASEDGGAPR
ncbi:MAG: LuxR C-terminal-related transcriptional regulator [Actinomycetota bacterium]